MLYSALLPLMRTRRLSVVDWTGHPPPQLADLKGPVLFTERRNMVSARVPSHFKRTLQQFRARAFILKPILTQVNNLHGSVLGDGYKCKEMFSSGYVRYVRMCAVSVICIMKLFVSIYLWYEPRNLWSDDFWKQKKCQLISSKSGIISSSRIFYIYSYAANKR